MISAGLGWTELLHGAVPHDVPHPPALVARLGPDVGAVLDDVPDLVTVVAGVLLLSAVLGDVSGAVTFVAAVLLLSTLSSEMPKSVALVALLASAPAAGPSVTSVPASVASAATASVGLRALSGEVTYPVAPVADRPATLLSRVGTLASEVTGPVAPVANTILPSSSSKPSTACSSSKSLTVTSVVVTNVGTLPGEMSGLFALVTNHFPDS